MYQNKIFVFLTMIFLFFTKSSFAAGGITHMMIAQETIAHLTDPELVSVIKNNMDAYLVGANYPDTGYVDGANYGEDSHWEPFVTAFIQQLRAESPHPEITNPRLCAFLLGVATHVMSDQPWHAVWIYEMTAHDFNGDHDTAHNYADRGLDLVILIEHNQWLERPTTWWVPVNDLVNVYHRMGKQYTADEIIWGNSVYSLAGYGERIIALPAYSSLRTRMPWSVSNYYTDPTAGVLEIEMQVTAYVDNVWQRILGQTPTQMIAVLPAAQKVKRETQSPLLNVVANLLKQGNANVPVKTNTDGSVELQAPTIQNMATYLESLDQIVGK